MTAVGAGLLFRCVFLGVILFCIVFLGIVFLRRFVSLGGLGFLVGFRFGSGGFLVGLGFFSLGFFLFSGFGFLVRSFFLGGFGLGFFLIGSNGFFLGWRDFFLGGGFGVRLGCGRCGSFRIRFCFGLGGRCGRLGVGFLRFNRGGAAQGNLAFDVFKGLVADAVHFLDVFQRLERAVLGAVVDDGLGFYRADAGQGIKLLLAVAAHFD